MDRPSAFAGASRLPQAWREDIAKGLVINISFNVRNEPQSMKSVDPSLVLTEVRCFIRPIFCKRTGDDLRYLWCYGIAKTTQRMGEMRLSDREDFEQVRAWQYARLHVSQNHIV
jgi:hypothetical protein